MKDESYDSGAVDGWVGDFGALEVDEVGECFIPCLLGRSNNVESTNTLTVQTEVFGKGLSDDEFEGVAGDEVADGPGIFVDVAGGEALVCRVEEGEEVFALAQVGDLLPLVFGGVDSGGVVGACVEQDQVSGLGLFFECGHHAGEVQAAGCGVVVGVHLLFDIGGGDVEDGVVVSPCRVGHPDALGLKAVVQEAGAQVYGTGSGDGLEGTDTGSEIRRGVSEEEVAC